MEEYTYGGGHLGTPEMHRIVALKGEEKKAFWREPKRSVLRFFAWFAVIGMIWPMYVLIWNLVN